jgi:hypothetical protein
VEGERGRPWAGEAAGRPAEDERGAPPAWRRGRRGGDQRERLVGAAQSERHERAERGGEQERRPAAMRDEAGDPVGVAAGERSLGELLEHVHAGERAARREPGAGERGWRAVMPPGAREREAERAGGCHREQRGAERGERQVAVALCGHRLLCLVAVAHPVAQLVERQGARGDERGVAQRM